VPIRYDCQANGNFSPSGVKTLTGVDEKVASNKISSFPLLISWWTTSGAMKGYCLKGKRSKPSV